MLIRESSDSPPWLIKGRVGWKSVVIMFLKKKNLKKKWRGELKSVDRIFALRAPPEVKGVALQSEQQIGSN